jgi:RNA polymerase sigma factor (sigma-70 family)
LTATLTASRVPSLPPFQSLLDEHAGAVMAVLRGAVGRDAAEDCFQETFLAALRAYPGLRPGSNARAWLLTIAQRKAVDHHRGNGRRPIPVAEVEDPRATAAEPLHRLPDEGLWGAVGALPPKQRAAVALRYASDYSHADIAAALGCTPEAARRSLPEGIKRLRKELE